MTQTMRRSAWPGLAAALALALAAESSGVSAEAATARSLPPGVRACDFGALANDHTREGLDIRAAPNAASAILGRLPVLENAYHEKIAADLHVIGVSNGWFLIEDAAYSDYDPTAPDGRRAADYAGRGWVSGRLLTAGVSRPTLKAAPDESAADVVEVNFEVRAKAILDCKGEWFRIETPLSTEFYTLEPKLPSDGPRDTVSGWTRDPCLNQRGACGG